jgi:hypothetical protein
MKEFNHTYVRRHIIVDLTENHTQGYALRTGERGQMIVPPYDRQTCRRDACRMSHVGETRDGGPRTRGRVASRAISVYRERSNVSNNRLKTKQGHVKEYSTTHEKVK